MNTTANDQQRRLVLEDLDGKVVRAYKWFGEAADVIRRSDNRRLEVVSNTQALELSGIEFERVGRVTLAEISKKPLLVGKLGHLKLVESIGNTETNLHHEDVSEKKAWKTILIVVALFSLLLMGVISLQPNTPTAAMEQEMRQEVVKIFKAAPPKPKVDPSVQMSKETQTPDQVVKTKTTNTLKRMGALAALGSLSNSKQRGGLNLGAANTTAGPGLGGTAGSGGVQTSLYARGITAAPLGAGGNIQGAGGYGTKGKGGGQAGYGKLSLVGSAGDASIGLAQEATVESGLDRDMIAAVINRNLGQVRFCYEQGLQGTPGLNGRVAVDFTIGGNGLVKAAGIDSSTMGSKIVEDCIVMRLKTWKFPLPQGGVDVRVTYPFVLRRAGQG